MSLPPLITLADHDGDWGAYIEAVYDAYTRDVVRGGLSFRSKRVSCKYNPSTDGKGFAFWHVVSEGRVEAERNIDLRRCERISWIGFMIQNAEIDDRIKWWKVTRGSATRIVLWLPDEDFAVVLEERDKFHLLWTAYTVRPHRRRQFEEEHQNYWATPENG